MGRTNGNINKERDRCGTGVKNDDETIQSKKLRETEMLSPMMLNNHLIIILSKRVDNVVKNIPKLFFGEAFSPFDPRLHFFLEHDIVGLIVKLG